MSKRWMLCFVMAGMLALPAAADARGVRYEGRGVKAKTMDVSFSFVDRNKGLLRRFSFDRIPMRCDDGRRYRTGGRRFGDAVRLNRKRRFKARGRGRFRNGTVEVANVRGRVRPGRGRAYGLLQLRASHRNGATCRSGEQRFRAGAA